MKNEEEKVSVEIKEVLFLTPARIKAIINGEEKIFLASVDIINKKVLDNDIINNKNFKNKMLENKVANIKVFDKWKVNGIGYILTVNTISVGNVKEGYTYQSKNGNVIFKIKNFEHNFMPQEFTYPDSHIRINPSFIKGNILLIDIYDEFYCIADK